MSIKKSTKRQLYWNTLVRIPTLVINFAISIIVARILSPDDFGIMGIVMMFVGYANLFTNLGFNQAIVQKNIRDKNVLDSIFTLDLAISLLLTILCYILSGVIADFFKTPECKNVLQVMSLVFIITSFQAIPHGVLRRDFEFKKFALIETSHGFFSSILTLVLALLGFSYWALAFGQLVPLTFSTVLFAYIAKWRPCIGYKHELMKEVYDFGVWSFVRTQLNFASAHIDKFIIGKWIGVNALGLYDKSQSLTIVIHNNILMNINGVLFSKFSENGREPCEVIQIFKRSLSLISLIIFPIHIGLIIVAPYFVHSLLGNKWVAMVFPFQLILLGSIFKSFNGFFTIINVGIGRYKEQSLRMLIAMLIFLLACLLLFQFGLNGIAVAFIIYSLVLAILGLSLVNKSLKVPWRDSLKCIICVFFPGAVMGLLIELLTFFWKDYTLFNLILLATAGVAIYFILILFNWNTDVSKIRNELFLDIKKLILH